MGRFLSSTLIALTSTIVASALLALCTTIYYHNGISERTLPAWLDAFLFLAAFSMPVLILIGLPLALLISAHLYPVVGLIVGTLWGVFLTYVDDMVTGPGISLYWSMLGTMQGGLIGLTALVIFVVSRSSKS